MKMKGMDILWNELKFWRKISNKTLWVETQEHKTQSVWSKLENNGRLVGADTIFTHVASSRSKVESFRWSLKCTLNRKNYSKIRFWFFPIKIRLVTGHLYLLKTSCNDVQKNPIFQCSSFLLVPGLRTWSFSSLPCMGLGFHSIFFLVVPCFFFFFPDIYVPRYFDYSQYVHFTLSCYWVFIFQYFVLDTYSDVFASFPFHSVLLASLWSTFRCTVSKNCFVLKVVLLLIILDFVLMFFRMNLT